MRGRELQTDTREHLEYFPYGETWVHNKATSGQVSTPYKFTSKELDEETGLYYYGARYYDARLSRWVSADKYIAIGEYLPSGDKENDKNLTGIGGVFNSINLDAYHYAGQNPVKLVDQDGNASFIIGAVIGFGVSVASEMASHWKDTGGGRIANLTAAAKATYNDPTSLKSIAVSTTIGAATSGLSSIVTTTKTATTVAQISKNVAKNVVKNAVVGGTGATANYMAQSKIKGNEIKTNAAIDAFVEGAVVSGVFTFAGEGFKMAGIAKTNDMTTSGGGGRNPTIHFSEPTGGVAAFGSIIPNSSDIFMSVYKMSSKEKK